MNYIPAAIKVIANTVFFCIYGLIGIIFGNFIYGLVLHTGGKVIPESHDPIHMKIAIVMCLMIFVITFYFRKYFYISLNVKIKQNHKKKLEKETDKGNSENEMKIYIDKEIK